MSFEKATSYLN